MPAPIQKLWQSVMQFPVIGRIVRERSVHQHFEDADEIPFRLPSLESGEPSAEEIASLERDRAERFKRDQLLPIMGMVGMPS